MLNTSFIKELREVLNEGSLFRSAGIYTLSLALSGAIPFFIMPVLTRYLSPADYGIVAMFAILTGIALPCVGLSAHGAISVKFFDRGGPPLGQYIGTAFLLMLGSAILLLFILWPFGSWIESLTAFPRQWLWTVIVVALAQSITLVVATLWQVREQPVPYALFQNSLSLVNMVLSVILVAGIGFAWQGRVLAQVAALLLFSALGIVFLIRSGSLRQGFDRSSASHLLRFGLPLIPHAVGNLFITQTDRLFIANLVGIADAGVYTVGFQIASVIELGAYAFNQAYYPWLFKRLSENKVHTKRSIVKFTYLYFAFILVVALAVSILVPPLIPYIVGKEFIGAGRFVFWLSLGFAFNGMYYMVGLYIVFAQKTQLMAWVMLFTASINALLNYVLITRNGTIGSAQATAVSMLLCFLLTWKLSGRVYTMPWRLSRTGSHANHND